MKNQKQEVPAWGWVFLIVVVVLGLIYFIGSGEDVYEKGCVDVCVYEMGYCEGYAFVFAENGEAWLHEDDMFVCLFELDYCMRDCET